MYRKRRILAVILAALVLLAAAAYIVYSKTIKDYVVCARMLSDVYKEDRSDLTFYVTINTAGQAIDTQFRAVRFPFQDSTATQVTIFGIKDNYTFYKVNGKNLSQDEDPDTEDGIPRNFMELLSWGKEIYE